MQFGQKKKNVKDTLDDDFQPYLRSFKNGSVTVRFLDECDDWIEFWEHFTTDSKSFPCTRDRKTCPGCTSDVPSMQKASRKYACNVYLIDVNRVLPFRIPVSLAKKMFTRSERNDDTITNRDYDVIRMGQGLDTEYDVETGKKTERDLRSLRQLGTHDIEQILAASFFEVWGNVGEPTAPKKSPVTIDKGDEDQPPFDKGDVELSVEELEDMSRQELLVLASRHKIPVDIDESRQVILRSILDSAG